MAEAGERSGRRFNDGVFAGCKQVFVGEDITGVVFLKFVYEKANGETEEVKHGMETGNVEQFEFNYPDEYITSVKWTVGHFESLRTLVFKTSDGKSSRTFGSKVRVQPERPVERKGRRETPAVVGFHGRFREDLVELDAHMGPAPPRKLDAIGGAKGSVWSDGKHEHVTKIRVGCGVPGISSIQASYRDGNRDVPGELHGRETGLAYPIDEFKLVGDFLVSVGVYRDLIGQPEEKIRGLEFHTFTGKSKFYGMKCGDMFSFNAHKIVGFHGRSSDSLLHSLGVFESFPPVPKLRGLWIELEQKGLRPGPRRSSAIALVGSKVFLFGGESSPDKPVSKAMHVFNCGTKTWSTAPATGRQAPDYACHGASMVSIGSTLYVYGGLDRSGKYSGFYSFDTTKNEWKLLEDKTTPRSFHSMAAIQDKLYIFGGISSKGTPLKTMASYNTSKNKWSEISTPGGSLAAREGAGLVVVEGNLWLLFGFNGRVLDDIYCYDSEKESWTQMQTSGEKPGPRSGFASGVSGAKILIFGGETGRDARAGPDGVFNGLYSLDTKSLKWEKLERFSEESGPSPRGSCASTTSSLDGYEGMLMFGGATSINALCDGFFLYKVVST